MIAPDYLLVCVLLAAWREALSVQIALSSAEKHGLDWHRESKSGSRWSRQ